MPRKRPDMPVIFVERPACDACRSPRLRVYKSLDQGDGSLCQYVRCQECGESQKIIWEIPTVFHHVEEEPREVGSIEGNGGSKCQI